MTHRRYIEVNDRDGSTADTDWSLVRDKASDARQVGNHVYLSPPKLELDRDRASTDGSKCASKQAGANRRRRSE